MDQIPSWLQAFAAIVALGIAVWGTLAPDRAAKRRERLRARCIATAILPDLLAIQVFVDRAIDIKNHLIERSKNDVGQHHMHTLHQMQIEIPPMLYRNIDNLYLLGMNAGSTCLQLISVIHQYNSLVNSATNQLSGKATGEWTDNVRYLEGHLKVIKMSADEAEREIAPIHDGK